MSVVDAWMYAPAFTLGMMIGPHVPKVVSRGLVLVLFIAAVAVSVVAG